MSLAIHRLRTRLVSATPVEAQRLAAWHDEFARLDGAAIASRWVGADEWLFIRRLPLQLRWRGDPVDSEVGSAWNHALAQGIAAALARDDSNCVRYPSRRAALADLIYRSALRDTTRQWAWHRMELIPRAQMDSEEVLRAGVEKLYRTPELVWPVLMRLIDGEEHTASLTAALRAIPLTGWLRLFEVCPRTAAFVPLLRKPEHGARDEARNEHTDTALQRSAAAHSLLRWAAARAHFVQQHRDVLTVLLCAVAGSAEGVSQATLRVRMAGVQSRLAAMLAPLAVPGPARAIADKASLPAPRAVEEQLPQRRRINKEAQPRLPELPDRHSWCETAFGGALFWLGRIAASGVLQRLAAIEEAQPLFLRELALALGVPADDMVLAPFCGGELPRRAAPPPVSAEAVALALEWERWLADAAPELPPPRVTAVCRRRGRIRLEPGWIELHLPLDGVDTSIRRLALDLDPDWLPWLGCVVRIVYDEA